MARAKMASAMTCPKCGAEMNFHAEKLSSTSPEDAGYNAALSGVVEEFHACPRCGAAATRLAADLC
jgi:ribosomal protein S27AE